MVYEPIDLVCGVIWICMSSLVGGTPNVVYIFTPFYISNANFV